MEYPWECLFAPHILARGRAYYEDGAVSELTRTADGYTAVVAGTEEYCVEIELEDQQVSYMECDCPYAAGGNYCKHMAAVLYAVEEKAARQPQPEKKEGQTSNSLTSLIATIPEQELRSILEELCREEPRIKNRIVLRYSKSVEEKQLKRLDGEFVQLCDQYSDHSGFIDWERAGDFACQAAGFLSKNTGILVERHLPLPAFSFVNHTLAQIGNLDIDDSGGELTYLASIGADCWSLILTACHDTEEKVIFDWFSQQINGSDLPDYLEDAVFDFYESEFQRPEFLRKKLEMYSTEGPIPSPKQYDEYFRYEHNAVQQLQLMEKLSYPEPDLQARVKALYPLVGVRKFAVDHALVLGDSQTAIKILRESKEMDAGYSGLVSQHSVRLIQLYQQQGLDDAYRQELLFYLFSCYQDDLEYIDQLKALCSESEWESYREKLLSATTCCGIRYSLLVAENMMKELLRDVLSSGSMELLDQYEHYLKKEYSQQVRDGYAKFVKANMVNASNRGRYRDLIWHLKKIRKYPGGKEVAAQIAREWRDKFPRRRAMLEELSHEGF